MKQWISFLDEVLFLPASSIMNSSNCATIGSSGPILTPHSPSNGRRSTRRFLMHKRVSPFFHSELADFSTPLLLNAKAMLT
jgi:hypothetical protein